MNEFATRVLTAPLGNVYLYSVGQAGFIIRSESGQLLAIDLYLSDCVERMEGNVGYKRMLPKILYPDELHFDVVIATHPHKDHFDDDIMPALLSNGRTRLYASVNCQREIKRLELDEKNILYVEPEDKYIDGDFSIEFIKCDHGDGAPDAVGVIITVNGKKIIEMGDTCLRMDWVDYFNQKGTYDVMIAPINGMYGNLNSLECAKLGDMIKPKLLIPCHYGMFALHMGSLGDFYNIMVEKYPDNNFRFMTQGEGMIIS